MAAWAANKPADELIRCGCCGRAFHGSGGPGSVVLDMEAPEDAPRGLCPTCAELAKERR